MPSSINTRAALIEAAERVNGDAQIKRSPIYQLNYIQGNVQRFKLIQFSKELDFFEVIRRLKNYCHENNLRFVFAEQAITFIEVEDSSGGVIDE